MNEIKFNTIEEAIEDFRNGKPIIVADDEDRENEGDVIIPAQFATPQIINFLISELKTKTTIELSNSYSSKNLQISEIYKKGVLKCRFSALKAHAMKHPAPLLNMTVSVST